MPRKNSIKAYVPDGYYHLYNNGIDHRKVFADDRDYQQFFTYMAEYLEPRNDEELKAIIADQSVHYKKRREASRILNRKNFSNQIRLFTFCLLPEQFHFILQQNQATSMQEFMRALMTRYSMYFNTRYRRKGTLFESAYRAVQITSDTQMIEASRTIHRMPLTFLASLKRPLHEHSYSSFHYYVNPGRAPAWLNTSLINSFYTKKYPEKRYIEYIETEE